MHLDSNWTRTGVTIAVLVAGMVANYSILSVSVSRNSNEILALKANTRELENKMNDLAVAVAVTKTIVERIENKLDYAIRENRRGERK